MNDLSNNTMSRAGAIARAERYFDSGAFKADLSRRVAIPSESQNPERSAELRHYIEVEMKRALEAMGFACRILTHPKARGKLALMWSDDQSPPKARAIRSHCTLWKRDRGAHKVAFGKLDATIAQNVVGGRVMKKEIR
jgi:hypothetical protein